MNLLVRLLSEGQTTAAYIKKRQLGDKHANHVDLFQILSTANSTAYKRLRDVEESTTPEVQDALRKSYLPVLRESEWEEARKITRHRQPVHSHRWVTFVPVAGSDGLTAPDDDSPR